MRKNNNHKLTKEQRKQKLIDFIDYIDEKYLSDLDESVGFEHSKTPSTEGILGVINALLLPKKDDPFAKVMKKWVNNEPITAEEREMMRKYQSESRSRGFFEHGLFKSLAEDIWWIYFSHAMINPYCPLHDTETVKLLDEDDQNYVMWLKKTSYYIIAISSLNVDVINELLPQLTAPLNIMNPIFVDFVINTPYRNIAAEMLSTSVYGLARHITTMTDELKKFVSEVEFEVVRYDHGFSDAEVYIMRIMAMVGDAIANRGLKDAWQERTVVR